MICKRALLVLALVVMAVMGHDGETGHSHGHAHGEEGGGSTAGQGEGSGEAKAVEEGLAARQEAWSKCDRRRSRLARGILNEEVYPIVEKRGYEFPQGCPLSKKTDMYLDNELHKKEVRYANWKCTYCQKVFKGESFLEQHFQNRHPYTIMRDGVCLGDQCDALECDLDMSSGSKVEIGSESRMKMAPGCSHKSMQRRRHRCQVMVDSCFPPHHSSLANELHHYFEELYCSHLSCVESDKQLRPSPVPEKLKRSKTRTRRGSSREEVRSQGWKKLYIVLGVLFGLLLVIFYLGMCLYRKDMTIVDDLRKLSNKKRKMRMDLLKAKNY